MKVASYSLGTAESDTVDVGNALQTHAEEGLASLALRPRLDLIQRSLRIVIVPGVVVVVVVIMTMVRVRVVRPDFLNGGRHL